MRVGISGSQSLLADALAERLARDGHEVVIFGSQLGTTQRTARLVSDRRAKFVRVDAEYRDDEVRRALRGEAHLVFLGCLSTGPARRADVASDVAQDVVINRAVLGALRGMATHIVYASSTSVYGLSDQPRIMETAPTSPVHPLGRAKLASERAVRRAARALGVTATVLRYATLFGPGEMSSGLVRSFIRAGIAGAPPEIEGDGMDQDDYVYIDDAVEAMVRALERRLDSTYNIGTGVGTPSLTLARAVLQLLDADVEPLLLARGNGAHTQIVCSTARAASDLGFTAWPYLHNGIQNEIAWLRQNARINAAPQEMTA